jgi:secretion/DNA translocation related TadE-like protein
VTVARHRANEQGSATILVIAAVMAVCVGGGIWLASGRAALARQHAETAADLAALAAAKLLTDTAHSPCSAAREAAAANGATLGSCTVAGDTITVAVSVSRPMAAHATARAGSRGVQ